MATCHCVLGFRRRNKTVDTSQDD